MEEEIENPELFLKDFLLNSTRIESEEYSRHLSNFKSLLDTYGCTTILYPKGGNFSVLLNNCRDIRICQRLGSFKLK